MCCSAIRLQFGIILFISLVYLASPGLRGEIPLLLGVALLGVLTDTALINSGVLITDNLSWLSTLWLAFATTLNHSLRPLLNRTPVFLVMTTIGGMACYGFGVELSSIRFGYSQFVSLGILALVWLVAGVLILRIFQA